MTTAGNEAGSSRREPQVLRWVFWPAAVIVLAFALFALLAPHIAEALFKTVQTTIVNASTGTTC